MSITMDPIQQYVPRRIANSREHKLPQYQNLQQPHQQLHPDGSLTSPYVSSSTASNNPQLNGDYYMMNCPAQLLVPFDGLPGGSSTQTTRQQNPSASAGWRQVAFHDHGRSTDATNLQSSSTSWWGSHYGRGQKDQAQGATVPYAASSLLKKARCSIAAPSRQKNPNATRLATASSTATWSASTERISKTASPNYRRRCRHYKDITTVISTARRAAPRPRLARARSWAEPPSTSSSWSRPTAPWRTSARGLWSTCKYSRLCFRTMVCVRPSTREPWHDDAYPTRLLVDLLLAGFGPSFKLVQQ